MEAKLLEPVEPPEPCLAAVRPIFFTAEIKTQGQIRFEHNAPTHNEDSRFHTYSAKDLSSYTQATPPNTQPRHTFTQTQSKAAPFTHLSTLPHARPLVKWSPKRQKKEAADADYSQRISRRQYRSGDDGDARSYGERSQGGFGYNSQLLKEENRGRGEKSESKDWKSQAKEGSGHNNDSGGGDYGDGDEDDGSGGGDSDDRDEDKSPSDEYEEDDDEEDEEEELEEDDESEYQDNGNTDSEASATEDVQQPPIPVLGGVSPVVERSSRHRNATLRSQSTPILTESPRFLYPESSERGSSLQYGQAYGPVVQFDSSRRYPTEELDPGHLENTPYFDYGRGNAPGMHPQFHADPTRMIPVEYSQDGSAHGPKDLRGVGPLNHELTAPQTSPRGVVAIQPSQYYDNFIYGHRGPLYQGDPRFSRIPPPGPLSPYRMAQVWGPAVLGPPPSGGVRHREAGASSPPATTASTELTERGPPPRKRHRTSPLPERRKMRRDEKPVYMDPEESSERVRGRLRPEPEGPRLEHTRAHSRRSDPSGSLEDPSYPQVALTSLPPPKPASHRVHQGDETHSSRSKARKFRGRRSRTEQEGREGAEREQVAAMHGKEPLIWPDVGEGGPYYGAAPLPYLPVQPSYGAVSMVPMVPAAATQHIQAQLEIDGDLAAMTKNWSVDEITRGRRLVRFHRAQNGVKIRLTFEPLSRDSFQEGMTAISCIWRRETQEYFVTSVDCITILELIMGQRFSIEEKNRTRRNLEACRPMTVSKNKPELESFFRQIMSFDAPRPRNIEKDLKVFLWSNLENALKKIVSKYSAVSYQMPPQQRPS